MMKLATEINMDRFHQSFVNMIQWHSQPASLHMKPWVLLWGFINFLSFNDASLISAIFGSDNGLAPLRRQAIIWTNDDLLSIMHLWMNSTEIYTILTLKRKCINIWVYFFIHSKVMQYAMGWNFQVLFRAGYQSDLDGVWWSWNHPSCTRWQSLS